MKHCKTQLILLLICIIPPSVSYAQNSDPIHYDGYYATLADTLNPFRYYLRFYPDGNVIGYSTAGNPKNLVKWFKKDHSSPSKGTYTIQDSMVKFSLKAEEGEIKYEGNLLPGNRMYFNVHSLINKYKGNEEYFFMKMEGLN